MVKNLRYKHLSKSGLSTIVGVVVLIALSLVAVAIVAAVVNTMLGKEMDQSKSCFGNYEKIKINEQYTCYSKEGTSYYLRFSLGIEDIDVDEVIITAYSNTTIKTVTLTNASSIITDISFYPDAGDGKTHVPAKNSGEAYKLSNFNSKIDSVAVIPVISGNQCSVSDTVVNIVDCALLA